MKSETNLSKELKMMLKEGGNICVSIIVPTHRLSPERRVDKLGVEAAVNKAKELLQIRYTVTNIKPLLASIDELYHAIDFTHNSDGVGLYISPNTKWMVQYPFPVEEKVMIGDNFEIRDLLYKEDYSRTYFVLQLSQKTVKLFECVRDIITEIKDKKFPCHYEEEYMYSTPSRSSSSANAQVKSVEKDKSLLEEIRNKDFFRHIDEMLAGYLHENTPLVLLGVEKEIAWFKKISLHNDQIVKTISGNYSYQRVSDIAGIVWPQMQAHLQQEHELLLKEFEEKVGEHHAVSGIQDVWQATKEGKAFKLLVEKDFRKPGFVEMDAGHLFLRPPQKVHRIVADAVDDIIEMVLEKNGQVFFTENGKLKDYGNIALITRY